MAELTPEKLFELTGETVAHTPTRRRFADLSPAERLDADAKANRLLVSLLDPTQRADHAATGTFWVDLADGSRVQLGVLHRQTHELPAGPVARRTMCVVPAQDIGLTPLADVWTNLLLVLQSNPEDFLAVANIWTEERRSAAEIAKLDQAEIDRHPERRLTERQLAQKVRPLIESGELGLASDLEAELARRLVRRGRYALAVRCGVGAAAMAVAVDAVDAEPDTRRPTIALATSLAPWLGSETGLLDRLIAATHRRLEIGLPDARRGEADRRVATFHERLENIVALTCSGSLRRPPSG